MDQNYDMKAELERQDRLALRANALGFTIHYDQTRMFISSVSCDLKTFESIVAFIDKADEMADRVLKVLDASNDTVKRNAAELERVTGLMKAQIGGPSGAIRTPD